MARELLVVLIAFGLLVWGALALHGHDPVSDHLGGGFSKVNWNLVDWNVHYWGLWDFHRVFTGEAGPLHTHSQFHPEGLRALNLHGDVLLKVLGGLLSLVVPPDGVHLLMVVVVLLGNAMGGYVLLRSLTGSRVAGVTVGLLFCFGGPTAWSVNTGNLEYGLWLWVCLYLTFLDRALRFGRWRDAGAAALFAAASAYCNLAAIHHVVLLSLVPLISRWSDLDRRRLGVVAATVMAVALLLLPLILAFGPDDGTVDRAAGGRVPEAFSKTDLPLAAMNSYPVWEYLPWRASPLKEDSSTPYGGWVLLGLSLVVARKRALPWVAAALVFFLLALGPYVHWGPRWREVRIPGPALVAARAVPLYDHVRFPHRAFGFAVISSGVAIGLGVARVTRIDRRSARTVVPVAIVAAVVLESVGQWDLRSFGKQPISPFYEQVAADPGEFALVEFPLDYGVCDSRYLFFQTRHGRPLFNGPVPLYFSRQTAPNVRLLYQNSLLNAAYQLQRPLLPRHLRKTLLEVPAVPEAPSSIALRHAREELAACGIRYLVVHHRIAWEPGLEVVLPRDNELDVFLRAALGEPAYSDGELDAFRLQAAD